MEGLIHLSYHELFFSAQEAKALLRSLGEFKPVALAQGLTARISRIEGFCGTVGFISPVSQPFCSSCNKVRLTSDGYLRSCLHSAKTLNLKGALDRGCSDGDLVRLIEEAVSVKPKSGNLSLRLEERKSADMASQFEDIENFSMCQIGG